jgi:S1-C subfamily serine protease
MVLMDDQHPFDVAPDDDRRSAAGAAAQSDEQTASEPTAEADAIEADGAAARAKHRTHRRVAALSVAAAVVFTAGAGGGAIASLALARSTTTASADGGSSIQGGPSGSGSQNGFGGGQGGFGRFGGSGSGSSGNGSGSGSSGTGSSSGSGTAATADQITGLVTVVSELGYESGEAAGTGIVLTPGGRILTNNHVIDGATSIEVTVESTGTSYKAAVVGTNAKKDVAVLQLRNASGLTPADLATGTPSVGDEVTAVGNANGTGTLSAAAGTVSALDQTITTSSEEGTAGETLHGLIQIAADVVSGDSGGAVEDSSGDVVGVTTAASSGGTDVSGYAIPIGTAVSIAKQIVAGDDTSEITIGLPAFLGVSIADDSSGSGGTGGAVVGQVLPGTAAAKTDLAAGDTITAVGGTRVASGAALSKVIATHQPGDRVTIRYTDADGASRTTAVTLMQGPAD